MQTNTEDWGGNAMDELREAKQTFLQAVRSSSDLPGINEINLAAAVVALLKAERIAPDSEETHCMQAVFVQLRRPDVYEAVKSAINGLQP
jgi:hypothetical protein